MVAILSRLQCATVTKDDWGGQNFLVFVLACLVASSYSHRVSTLFPYAGTRSWYDANFVLSGSTVGCHNDSMQCQQWWWNWHHDNSQLSWCQLCHQWQHHRLSSATSGDKVGIMIIPVFQCDSCNKWPLDSARTSPICLVADLLTTSQLVPSCGQVWHLQLDQDSLTITLQTLLGSVFKHVVIYWNVYI